MNRIVKRPDFIENDLPGNREIPVHNQRQKQGTVFSGEEYPDEEVTVPQPLAELLLRQAAQREVSLEEIVTHAFKNQLGRSENDGW